MENKRPIKTYVRVDVVFDEDGRMLPRALVWEDGHRYEIDKVKLIRPAAAERAGSGGDRYTIVVEGKEKYLFFERSTELMGNQLGRWFVERKAC
jgi:hypothetical protein